VAEGIGFSTDQVEGRVLSSQTRPGRIEVLAEADQRTVVLVREAFSSGWTARVNGQPAPALRANGRHLAVPVEAGTSRIELLYHPPRWTSGLLLSMASASLVPWLARPRRAAAS
jgi:uncharacterized membrane protein YfhO